MSEGTLEVSLKRAAPFPIDVHLFGPSGCGKTTVVDMNAGARPTDSGRVVVAGRVLYDSARGISLPVRERRIGYVFQEARLFPHLSVVATCSTAGAGPASRCPDARSSTSPRC